MSTSTRPRRWTAGVVAALFGILAVLLGASPAWASGYIYYGPSGSYGMYDFSIVDDNLRLYAQPTNMASGKCYDEILDWDRGGGHYDARLARSCKSLTARDTQVSNESSQVNLVSVQKLGVCYGTNQATNVPTSNCQSTIGGMSGINTKVGTGNLCVRAWSMTPAGSLQFYSGGIPWECYQ